MHGVCVYRMCLFSASSGSICRCCSSPAVTSVSPCTSAAPRSGCAPSWATSLRPSARCYNRERSCSASSLHSPSAGYRTRPSSSPTAGTLTRCRGTWSRRASLTCTPASTSPSTASPTETFAPPTRASCSGSEPPPRVTETTGRSRQPRGTANKTEVIVITTRRTLDYSTTRRYLVTCLTTVERNCANPPFDKHREFRLLECRIRNSCDLICEE